MILVCCPHDIVQRAVITINKIWDELGLCESQCSLLECLSNVFRVLD